jgi:hypothetical protein
MTAPNSSPESITAPQILSRADRTKTRSNFHYTQLIKCMPSTKNKTCSCFHSFDERKHLGIAFARIAER